jgi:mRNA interferase MazF
LSYIVIDQIRTIDKKRVIKIIGELSEKEIEKVKVVMREMLID